MTSQAEAILEMIDNLVEEGYTVQIKRYGYSLYAVEILDDSGKQIVSTKNYGLVDAIDDAYQLVPEKEK